MKSDRVLRTETPSRGSYVSVPGAFKGTAEGLKHFVKMEFGTRLSKETADPLGLDDFFSTDRLLLDFGAVDVSALDMAKIARDCDLLKEAVLKHPGKIRQLAEAQTESPSGYKKAVSILQEIGLTEESATRAGGGLFMLLVLVALVLIPGTCAHCAAGRKPGK